MRSWQGRRRRPAAVADRPPHRRSPAGIVSLDRAWKVGIPRGSVPPSSGRKRDAREQSPPTGRWLVYTSPSHSVDPIAQVNAGMWLNAAQPTRTSLNVAQRAETEGFETSVSGGQRAHVKSCGQSVGTGLLDDDPTSISILLEPSESVSFPLDTIALNALACSGKPLTTAVPTSETERDGTKRNEPDRNRLKRKSIRPKMAVTVGFEPKEVGSVLVLLDL